MEFLPQGPHLYFSLSNTDLANYMLKSFHFQDGNCLCPSAQPLLENKSPRRNKTPNINAEISKVDQNRQSVWFAHIKRNCGNKCSWIFSVAIFLQNEIQ